MLRAVGGAILLGAGSTLYAAKRCHRETSGLQLSLYR